MAGTKLSWLDGVEVILVYDRRLQILDFKGDIGRDFEICNLKFGIALLALPVFRDVHDLVFENKQIGLVFAGQPDHVLVVVFDPAPDYFTVRQLDAYRLLFFTERLQVYRFLRGLLGRRGSALARRAGGSLSVKRHRSHFTRCFSKPAAGRRLGNKWSRGMQAANRRQLKRSVSVQTGSGAEPLARTRPIPDRCDWPPAPSWWC